MTYVTGTEKGTGIGLRHVKTAQTMEGTSPHSTMEPPLKLSETT